MEFVDTKVNAFIEDKKTRDTLWVHSTDSYDREMGGWIFAIREHCKIQQPPVFKGNWAYVYICKDFWLAAVDHYASVNLFFNDEIITHNWKLIEGYDDPIGVEQKHILQRMLVGSRTTAKGVKRIPPGHYAINGEIHEYCNFRNLTFPESQRVVKSFETVCNHVNGVTLYSGGTDSYMLACETQDKNSYLNITSDTIKYNVTVLNPNITINEFKVKPESSWTDGLYTEPTMNYKLQALKSSNTGQYVLTGECGNAPLMSTHLVHAYVNQPKLSQQRIVDSIIRLLRNDTHIWDVGRPDDTLSSDYPEGYKEISDYFLNKLQDKRYDMLTKLVTIYAEEHTNYRLYPYSQHLRTNWYHPFSTALWASCYSQNTIVARPRKHLFYIVSLRKNFPQLPWSIPKVGMSIPTKEKHVRTKT